MKPLNLKREEARRGGKHQTLLLATELHRRSEMDLTDCAIDLRRLLLRGLIGTA